MECYLQNLFFLLCKSFLRSLFFGENIFQRPTEHEKIGKHFLKGIQSRVGCNYCGELHPLVGYKFFIFLVRFVCLQRKKKDFVQQYKFLMFLAAFVCKLYIYAAPLIIFFCNVQHFFCIQECFNVFQCGEMKYIW